VAGDRAALRLGRTFGLRHPGLVSGNGDILLGTFRHCFGLLISVLFWVRSFAGHTGSFLARR
jgi:hypothetical protein